MNNPVPSPEQTVALIENALQTDDQKKLGLSTIAAVLSQLDGAKRCIGWAVATSYSDGAGTTKFCLIVASTANITIGINDGARQQASPGRTWKQLAPWRPEMPSFQTRLQAWVKDKVSDRITIPTSEKPAVLKILRIAHRKQALSAFAISRNEAHLDGVDRFWKRSLSSLKWVCLERQTATKTKAKWQAPIC